MTKGIVVGVDGSPASLAALRWAVGEARLRGATVEAIHVWAYPYIGDIAGIAASVARFDFETNAKQVLADALRTAFGDEQLDVRVDERVVCGSAATVLIEAARDAELLVVGGRGHGALAGLVLGSVSQQCTHHAPCPVVVVPASDDERELGS